MASSSDTPEMSPSLTRNDQHRHQRRFIGPMPERVFSGAVDSLSSKKKKPRLSSSTFTETSSDSDAGVKDIIKVHAYRFFIGHGGREEDWDEDRELGIREEMFQRWRKSDWGMFHSRKRKDARGPKWIGDSFEVGNFLGVNMHETRGPSSIFRGSGFRVESTSVTTGRLSAVETSGTSPSIKSRQQTDNSMELNPINDEGLGDFSATSSTALLQANTSTTSVHALYQVVTPQSFANVKSDGILNDTVRKDKGKGKGKQVHYSNIPIREEPAPVSPIEVLARTGDEVEATSAGAAEAAQPDGEPVDFIMRDRMLIRVSYTHAEDLGGSFDENQNRITHHLEYEEWAEFIVVWRKERLELYEDYVKFIPLTEWFTKHKRLAYVIPLYNPQQTKVSLYSFVDLTFCIICPPTIVSSYSKPIWSLRQAKRGRNIFVFKLKSRSRAQDWIWNLWRHLGGRFPPFIEIRSPALDTRIRVDLPDFDSLPYSNCGVFTRDNTIDLCRRSLSPLREYEWMVQKLIDEGSSLELAWRSGTKLDWVWQMSDVKGRPRDCAVLCGLSLKQGKKPAHLEVRLQQHNPMTLHLRDGTRLDEPLAVEGYLDRIKPNTQTKQPIYLATHDGYLFSMAPYHAFPPSPPGMLLQNQDELSFHAAGVIRGCKQILESTGISDLRSIVAVRRAFQITARHQDIQQGTSDRNDDTGLWEPIERTDTDDEDMGGEEGLKKFNDRGKQRFRRSFELVLTTGYVLRFEAYSCHVALEWIHRLRALVMYWRERHKVDAKQEMDLAHFGNGKPRLTPFRHVHIAIDEDSTPEPPPDPRASLPELSSIYNWCVIQGCRPVLRCGKLFVRQGLRGQYKHVQLVLVAGHLIQYEIKPTPSLHCRKSRIINLIDAYICSGYFAAQSLPDGQFNPDDPPVARKYQDGLETEDPEEDTLFTIWYRQQSVGAGDESGTSAGAQLHKKNRKAKPATLPSLSAKRKMELFRTRSKLERDSWCWAVSTEIEKTVRNSPERENKLRETGDIIKT